MCVVEELSDVVMVQKSEIEHFIKEKENATFALVEYRERVKEMIEENRKEN